MCAKWLSVTAGLKSWVNYRIVITRLKYGLNLEVIFLHSAMLPGQVDGQQKPVDRRRTSGSTFVRTLHNQYLMKYKRHYRYPHQAITDTQL